MLLSHFLLVAIARALISTFIGNITSEFQYLNYTLVSAHGSNHDGMVRIFVRGQTRLEWTLNLGT